MKSIVNVEFQQLDEQAQQQIIAFGKKQIKNTLLNVGLAFVISLCFGKLAVGVVLYLFFIPLRSNAGGLHVESKWGCLLVTIVSLVAALLLFDLAVPHLPVCAALTAAGSIAVVALAPVDTAKKRLDETERAVYRKRSLCVLLVEVVLFALFAVLGIHWPATLIAFAVALAGLNLVIGWVINLATTK